MTDNTLKSKLCPFCGDNRPIEDKLRSRIKELEQGQLEKTQDLEAVIDINLDTIIEIRNERNALRDQVTNFEFHCNQKDIEIHRLKQERGQLGSNALNLERKNKALEQQAVDAVSVVTNAWEAKVKELEKPSICYVCKGSGSAHVPICNGCYERMKKLGQRYVDAADKLIELTDNTFVDLNLRIERLERLARKVVSCVGYDLRQQQAIDNLADAINEKDKAK